MEKNLCWDNVSELAGAYVEDLVQDHVRTKTPHLEFAFSTLKTLYKLMNLGELSYFEDEDFFVIGYYGGIFIEMCKYMLSRAVGYMYLEGNVKSNQDEHGIWTIVVRMLSP